MGARRNYSVVDFQLKHSTMKVLAVICAVVAVLHHVHADDLNCLSGGLKADVQKMVDGMKAQMAKELQDTKAQLASVTTLLKTTQAELVKTQDKIKNVQITWPAGKYCVFMKTKDCPPGLRSQWGGIYWECCHD